MKVARIDQPRVLALLDNLGESDIAISRPLGS